MTAKIIKVNPTVYEITHDKPLITAMGLLEHDLDPKNWLQRGIHWELETVLNWPNTALDCPHSKVIPGYDLWLIRDNAMQYYEPVSVLVRHRGEMYLGELRCDNLQCDSQGYRLTLMCKVTTNEAIIMMAGAYELYKKIYSDDYSPQMGIKGE